MSERLNVIVDNSHEVIEKATSIVTYTASAGTVIGGFTLNEWLGFGGLCVALASFGFNVWFKMKYKRKP